MREWFSCLGGKHPQRGEDTTQDNGRAQEGDKDISHLRYGEGIDSHDWGKGSDFIQSWNDFLAE